MLAPSAAAVLMVAPAMCPHISSVRAGKAPLVPPKWGPSAPNQGAGNSGSQDSWVLLMLPLTLPVAWGMSCHLPPHPLLWWSGWQEAAGPDLPHQ